MNGSKVIDHGQIIGGKYATSKAYIPRTIQKQHCKQTEKDLTGAEASAAASFDPGSKIQQKTLTLRPNGERLGINLTWGMETSLKEAGLYIQAVHAYAVADLAGCMPGDRCVVVVKSPFVEGIHSESFLSTESHYYRVRMRQRF